MHIHEHLRTFDLVVIAAYLVVLLGIGVCVSYRRRHEEDQFLAGRSFGWFNVGLSIFGTNISPSMMIASAAAAYSVGMAPANFEWLAWPFLMLLAMVFAPHYRNTNISTMPQFIRRRFGPHAAEFLSWYALLSTVILWLGGTLYAGGVLLSQIMDWPLWGSVMALVGVATFLTVAGGLAVVIVTDTFQSLLMIVGISALTIIGVYEVGGIDELIGSVSPERWHLLRPTSDKEFPWHAMLLGYPVLGIWFWCTDQTIVQRMLGARDLRQAQFGALFTAFLKILTPFIFVLPGILCFVLHPNLNDANEAFTTMVVYHLPSGMIGLIVAVLIAALISTIDSGLNSFSTIFTLDIYQKKFSPEASPREIRLVGRIVTVMIAMVAVGCSLAMQYSEKNLFDLLQGIISKLAPPVASVFLVGVLWKRATATAATWTLYLGSVVSLGVGMVEMFKGSFEKMICRWIDLPLDWTLSLPHYMLTAFYLFVGTSGFMVGLSLLTRNAVYEERLPTLVEVNRRCQNPTAAAWLGWTFLAVIMIGLYVLFH